MLFHGLSLSAFSIGRLQDLASSRPTLEANTKEMKNERKIDVVILIPGKGNSCHLGAAILLLPRRIRIRRLNFVGSKVTGSRNKSRKKVYKT